MALSSLNEKCGDPINGGLVGFATSSDLHPSF
jgi:hypothetical protein